MNEIMQMGALAVLAGFKALFVGTKGVSLAAASLIWADADRAAGKKGAANKISGQETVSLAQVYAKAAADGDGSVIYLALVPSNYIPRSIELNADAIAGLTSVSLGLYDRNQADFSSSKKAVFLSAYDIHLGAAMGSEVNGLTGLGVANIGKKLWELVGQTAQLKDEAYTLALTLATAGANPGNIGVRATFIKA